MRDRVAAKVVFPAIVPSLLLLGWWLVTRN